MSEALMFQSIVIVCATFSFAASLQFLHRFLELRQKRAVPSAIDGLHERLERIEVAVDATAIEVERIAEANRFMAKLLSERGAAMSPASRPERVITPH